MADLIPPVSDRRLRLQEPSTPESVSYDRHLDGLRGFAAVSVMAAHGPSWLGEGFQNRLVDLVRNFHMARIAVFLFFITSGYVIGLTNQKPFSGSRVREYLRRRELRLMPIYLLAVVAGVLAWPINDGASIAANLFFLQNPAWHLELVSGNPPVWSLHYEVVYYLGFLLVWAYRPRIAPLLLAILFFVGLDWFFATPLSFLGGWGAGAVFWLAGLWLAWNRQPCAPTPFIALILLAFATNWFWPGLVLLRGLGFPYAGNAAVSLADLSFFPISLVLFCAIARLEFPGLKLLRGLAVALPVGVCLILFAMGRLSLATRWQMATIAIVIAIPLLFFERANWGMALIDAFAPLGKISYALYLFHVPCVLLVIRLYPWPTTWLGYTASIACWLALSFAASWCAEAVMQPAIMNKIGRAS